MVRTHSVRLFACAALVAASVSCSSTVRQGSSPVYLVIDSLAAAQGNKPGTFNNTLTSDVVTNVTSPAPCTTSAPCPTIFPDIGQVKLRAVMKDVPSGATPTTPSPYNDVTLTRYHVEYTRTDGRNTPGVDVPYAFDGAATVTVLAGGSTQATMTFEIVRYQAKMEAPLTALKVNPGVITTIAKITFYGKDQTGNEISVSGTMQIDFGNFGD